MEPTRSQRILVVDDEPSIVDAVATSLRYEGFSVDEAANGRLALSSAQKNPPDLIVLDIMLPDQDGLEICKSLRKHPDLSHTPVVFLTARASETDRIIGLELGASDYIVKPFFVRELVARVKAHLRGQHPVAPRIIRFGALELDRDACTVRLSGDDVVLTATEFRLLEYLMSRPGVVSKIFDTRLPSVS